ncbi:MAG: hypothetical protein H6Q73_3122 [Firmicutes bacterium]|nr:hypothetical protein [Bacillota bacterium]
MVINRIIRAPRPNTIALLLRRMSPEARKQVEDTRFDAIGLIQTNLPSLFYYTDIGLKAGNVIAVEIVGNCPQHVNTMAFFGSNEAVNATIEAITTAKE